MKDKITLAGRINSRSEYTEGPYWFIGTLYKEDLDRIEHFLEIIKTVHCHSVSDCDNRLDTYDQPIEPMLSADMIITDWGNDLVGGIESGDLGFDIEDDDIVNSDDMEMIVTEDYVHWEWFVKHTSLVCETPWICVEDIRKAFNKE